MLGCDGFKAARKPLPARNPAALDDEGVNVPVAAWRSMGNVIERR